MNRLQVELDLTIRLEFMGHMITDTFWDGFEHTHAFDEFLYILKGPVLLKCGEESRQLQRGEFCFVPKNTTHRVMSREPASFLYVGFQTNLAPCSAVKVVSKSKTASLAELSVSLEEMAEKALVDRVPFTVFSPDLLVKLIPALCSLEHQQETKDPKVVLSDKVKQYIKENYHKPIRVDEIAAGLYHSPHYVGNVFAAVNGITIKEYVLQYKMQKALALLGNEGLSVSGVATALGYDSPHYFSKCFKSHFGFSPSKLPHTL